MAKQHDDNSVLRNRLNFLPYSKKESKQIQNGNLSSAIDVKSVRDLFIFSEKQLGTKSFGKMEAWIEEENKNVRRAKRDFNHHGNLLRRLRTETSSKVNYKFVPSPEFKPGSYYLLPEKRSSFDYNSARVARSVPAHYYITPRNQPCQNNITRKEFCEVIGKEMCFECNGAKLREKFNLKMNSLYPFLEYDKVKRPYGYCPRAVRLTEPLPSRVDWRVLGVQGGDCASSMSTPGIQSGREKCSGDTPMRVFIKPRPCTS